MKSILLKTSEIVPSQNFVKPDTIRMILDRWINCNKQGLPPKPLVRVGKQGKYIAIDGHNLLVISDLFDGECEVFVVENVEDILRSEDLRDISEEAIMDRNRELVGKFEKVDNWAGQLREKGMCTITDLRRSVSFLEDIKAAKEFLDSSSAKGKGR